MEEGLFYCPSEMKLIHLLCCSDSLLYYCDRDSVCLLNPTDPLQSQVSRKEQKNHQLFVIFACLIEEPFSSIFHWMKRAANLLLIPICFSSISSSSWSTIGLHNIFRSTDECVTKLFTESDYPINGRREVANVAEYSIRSIGEGAEWVIEGGQNGVGQCLWIINRASLSPQTAPLSL